MKPHRSPGHTRGNLDPCGNCDKPSGGLQSANAAAGDADPALQGVDTLWDEFPIDGLILINFG